MGAFIVNAYFRGLGVGKLNHNSQTMITPKQIQGHVFITIIKYFKQLIRQASL